MFLEYLEPDVLMELSKTEEGKRKIRQASQMARIAMTIYEQVGYLIELKVFNRDLTSEEQENLANIAAWCMFEANHNVLLNFLHRAEENNQHDCMGSC